jgi:iron complex outermembrane receptor protein
MDNWYVGADYSYINQDKQDDVNIVSQYALEYLRHKLVGKAGVMLTKKLNLGLVLRWQDRVGSYTDFDGQAHKYRPYVLADARLTWQEAKWKAYVEGNNLTGTRYHDYGLVEQPGLWVVAGVNIRL